MKQPLISVIIPVYNAQLFLQEAIESVIHQTYKNLQIIITDDGSTDNSVSIARQLRDERIEIYVAAANQGQAHQLNLGISKATGEFICIMHADDIMNIDKLDKQYEFLLNNPTVGICGCNLTLTGSKTGEVQYPEYDQQCKDMLLSAPPFAHSAVLARKQVFENHYPVYSQHLVPAEDYDLWVRLARTNVYANIQEPLLQYRIHPEQIGTLKKDKEEIVLTEIRKKIIARCFEIKNDDEIDKCFNTIYATASSDADDTLHCIQLLWNRNKKIKFFSAAVLKGRLKHVLLITMKKYRCTGGFPFYFHRRLCFKLLFLRRS
ncbi:MAG: glycosyltransferase [Chitinophagaceae bacterium]|nr:glycosyltransferase [Chitinophagaceae bacterium]